MSSPERRGARATAAAGARVPDFFIVGHAKCGTTALHDALELHPRIWLPDVKEPRYLASDLRRRFTPARSGQLPETLEEYLALYADAPADAIAGDVSPSYVVSHTAPRLIAELAPHARAIAIFREPASFLRSLHLQLIQSHVETEPDLRVALSLEQERARGHHIPRRSHRPQALQYSEHVRYAEQIERLREQIPPERLLMLIYDDLRADGPGTLDRVLEFVGADPAQQPAGPAETNPTVLIRSQGLDEAVNALAAGRGAVGRTAQTVAKAVVPAGVRRRALRAARSRLVAGEPPAPDDQLMRTLRRRYKGEVERFGNAIGRDLVALWGYDRN